MLFTAFAKETDGGTVYTLHVANVGSGRSATIEGIPPEVKSLRAIRTSETEAYSELDPVEAENGRAELQLPPLSLLTLTTTPSEE